MFGLIIRLDPLISFKITSIKFVESISLKSTYFLQCMNMNGLKIKKKIYI